MNQMTFQDALDQVLHHEKADNGIGTLSEKTIHAVLKHYYSGTKSNEEQKIGSYVADIRLGNHIIEIQTRNFSSLRHKLDAFLVDYDVTIVYPIAKIKWLRWVNETSGEISPKRKSPKTGSLYQIFKELYGIKNYLTHSNLHVHIVLLEVEEYRLLNGWSKDRKKGSTRNDGIPLALLEEYFVDTLTDYAQFLSPELPDFFTVKDYRKVTKLPLRQAGIALNILHHLGIIEFAGKQGHAYLYTRTPINTPIS